MIASPLGRAALAFGAALAAGLLVTPLVRSLAVRLGYVNQPAADRWAERPTALLGGVGIVVSVVLGLGLMVATSGSPGEIAGNLVTYRVAIGIGVAAALMFVVGLLDDIFNLTPHLKFILQVVSGAVLVGFGGVIPLTAWYTVNALFSVFWFVAITNAVNLLDNMDGVASGVGGIAAFFLGLSCLRHGSWLEASLAWALTGACVGFLRYNFKPASIFMGDAGSLFIGAILAGVALVADERTTSASLVSVLFVPLLIVSVPILDTALVTITRAVAGRAFYQGGRDHTTHRLVALGLSERQTAVLLYAFALAGGLLAQWLRRLDGINAMAVGGAFLVTLSLAAAYLGHLRIEYTNEPRGSRTMTVLVNSLLYKRRLAEIVLDGVLCGLALIAAVLLRFDTSPPERYLHAMEQMLPVAIGVQLLALSLCGVYRGAWRYVGLPEVHRIAAALLLSMGVLLAYAQWKIPVFAESRGIIYTNLLCSAALVLTARLSFRSLHLLRRVFHLRGDPVVVYGAGDAGEMALREIRNNPSLALTPVCLLDDDKRKHGARIHGVPVVGGVESAALVLEQYQARKIVIATTKLRPEVTESLRSLAARANVALVELDLRFRSVDTAAPASARSSGPARRVSPAPQVVRPAPHP